LHVIAAAGNKLFDVQYKSSVVMQFRRTQKRSWPRLTVLVTFTVLFAILYVAADGETPMLSLLSHFHKHVELLPTDVRTRHCNATQVGFKKSTRALDKTKF